MDQAIALQEDVGLAVVTDGEKRRLSFQSQMVEAVDGFGEFDINAFLWGQWHGDPSVGDWALERPTSLGAVSKLKRKRSLSCDEFDYLHAHTCLIPKITLPAASLWANFWSPEHSVAAYPTLEGFLADIVIIMREEVAELVRLGATYIQFDAPHYTLLLDPKTRAFYESRGGSLERWLSQGIETDNAVMAGFSEISFGFHLCRGNQGSRWLVAGGYDRIAEPLFRRVHADRLLLEYDDDRSGSFAPLKHIPEDKIVVLGLVSTKRPSREKPQALIERIEATTQFIPLERLALSPQCGFSTSVVGNRISMEGQKRKLALVVETAERVWGE